ncbi:TIGR04053 family radical SAM/SPASM domain-containing protein [Poriferisphaera sp. WC338]|uniref:TIGR04053 family radical SAM/SPASM domain-containing protein n=1 Tax=Poriferisphaera sp. WC338 TaxID=3425129 RepID=UPI003D814E40
MQAAWNYQIEDAAHSPLLVFYEVTRACDLVCKHCRACAQPQSHPNEMDTAQSKNFLKQLTTFPKKPIVVLTGGDPLKRDDIFELIEYATQDCKLDVSFVPSATPLLDDDVLKQLKAAGISRLGLSIDGADIETHDEQRGIPGTFTHAINILKRAHELGIETQVNTTITKANVNQIDAMGELMATLNIALWSVFFLVPVGRGLNDLRIEPHEYKKVFKQINQQSAKHKFAVKTTEAPFFRRYMIQNLHQQKENGEAARNGHALKEKTNGHANGRAKPSLRSGSKAPLGINDGKGIMFVSHIGDVYPSGFLPANCGNVKFETAVDIYQKHETFLKLRRPELLKGKCGYCGFRDVCGGSRARAKAVTGDMFAPEPDCEFCPPAWLDHLENQRTAAHSAPDMHTTVDKIVNLDLICDDACTCQQCAPDHVELSAPTQPTAPPVV